VCFFGSFVHKQKRIIKYLKIESSMPPTTNYKPQTTNHIQVGIIMGSDSDLPVMQAAADILKEFAIEFELTVVSAHRTPMRMVQYATEAKQRGLKVIIAGAGGAAHLPGMIASLTPLPVIGVPIRSSNSIDGWDSVLSILQMPNGIPVATVALNAAKNAGILAASIIGAFDEVIGTEVELYKKNLESDVLVKIEKLKKEGWQNNFDK
jgi:5-(carboxyamino)imidazole ribonucleotide mutase